MPGPQGALRHVPLVLDYGQDVAPHGVHARRLNKPRVDVEVRRGAVAEDGHAKVVALAVTKDLFPGHAPGAAALVDALDAVAVEVHPGAVASCHLPARVPVVEAVLVEVSS